jgi:titin
LDVPGVPVITGVSPGETSAQVAFTADDSGGSTITRLEFALDDTTVVDDSIAPPPLSSSYTLSNLSPGTAYTVYMRAVNTAGTGPWSAPRSFTTLDVPGVPVITGVSPGETSAQVAFTADDSGGSTITRLEFALDDTTVVDDSTAPLSSPYTLTNLSPGTAYTVYMRAVNAVGAGPWSAPQGFATSSPPAPPSPPNPVVFPPGAPTRLTAVAADASASVSWLAPTSAGSFPVTDYEVASVPIGGSCLVKAPATSCEVTGLANGTSYTFTVRALNGAGWGAWSAPSNAVTPSPSVVKAIQITGSRDASDTRVVRVSGTTTDLVGEQVTPWVRFPGQGSFTAGTGVRTVAADGTFAWSRATGKKVHVYFTHGSIKSNTVVIAAR